MRLALTTFSALPVGPVTVAVNPQSSDPPDPAALSVIARANFPTPQPLSVTLVPPASPLSAIATANFPTPQPLSVTLAPPASPLAAIASAKFPAPQPLSVTLYAGEPLVAAPTFAGIAPGMTLSPSTYVVQIVQVIPRRGVDFFDRRNPAGQPSTTLVAQAGGGAPPGPVTSGVDVWICAATVWVDGLGVPNVNMPVNPSMQVTGGNGVNATVTLLAPWDPVPGTNPTFSGGTLVFPGQIGFANLAAGCPGANPGSNRWQQRLRTVDDVTLQPLPHVCVRRDTGGLIQQACDAQGN